MVRVRGDRASPNTLTAVTMDKKAKPRLTRNGSTRKDRHEVATANKNSYK